MSLRCRTFLLADDGTLCRLANARFDRMLRDPASYRLPALAGQRVRMANVFVEVVDRVPVCVIRSTFAMLTIDEDGRIDSSKFTQQQFALAETALARVVGDERGRGADAWAADSGAATTEVGGMSACALRFQIPLSARFQLRPRWIGLARRVAVGLGKPASSSDACRIRLGDPLRNTLSRASARRWVTSMY